MRTSSSSGAKLSPFVVMKALKRRRYYFLVPVLLLTSAVAFYVLHMQPRFRTRALVAVDAPQTRLTFGNRTDLAAVTAAQDQLRLVRETILNPAGLENLNREFTLYPVSDGHPSRKAMEDLKSTIHIQLEGTDAFYIEFEGRTPQQTMAVTNRLASEFVNHTTSARDRRVTQEDSFLDAEVARMRAQVDEQDNKVRAYKQSGAQELPERLASNLKQMELLQQEVQSKTDQITSAEATRSADMTELASLEKQGVLDPEPHEKTQSEIGLDEARRKLAQLKARYTSEHPEVIRAEKEVRDLEAAPAVPAPVARRQPSPVQMRYFALQAELKALEPRLNSYRQERDALMAQLNNYDRVVNSSPGVETGISERMRDAAVTRASYETLLAKQQEARLNHRAEKIDDGVSYHIIEPAQLPVAPYSPHRIRLILLGLMASLGLGIAGVVLAERMDTTFDTGEQFEEAMGAPILSTIPSISAGEARQSPQNKGGSLRADPAIASTAIASNRWQHLQRHRVPVLTHPDSIAAQQYRVLALKIQRWASETGGKVLAITSSTGEEGKSVTALNLSLALAAALEGGVLLVDCDLRLPQVHERLGLNSDKGLADLLFQSDGDIAPYISKVGDLDVIHAGSQSRSKVDLLGTSRTRDLFARLRSQYKIVVLDCPPVVPIADSLALAGLADGVVMVVRARSTRPELFQRAVDSLEAKNFVGVVLNDVQYSATPYAYAYRYYQQHYVDRH